MSIRVYVSTCSGNMEIKKKQDFIVRLLELQGIKYEEIDITNAMNEEAKQFMRQNARPSGNQKTPIPPQIFAEEEYLGDYEDFHEAVECETLYEFLKMAPPKVVSESSVTVKSPEEPPEEEEVEEEPQEEEE